VARGLRQPVQVVARPGDRGRLYVAEQGGRVRVLAGGRVLRRPYLDIRRRVMNNGERGLLTIAFDPRGRHLYAMYSARDGATRIVRYRAGARSALRSSARRLLTVAQPYENHKGGTLVFDERGRIVVGLGDGGSAFDPQQRAQDERSRLGKLLRLDPARPDLGWRVVATGLRNPWRMAFDRVTGMLWLGDVGQDRVEEVDALYLPEDGQRVPNLGWAAYEGDLPLGRKRLAAGAALVWPVAGYRHREGRCSITGGHVYRGGRNPRLRGRYVYGDFCRGVVWSLAADGVRDPRALDVRREVERVPGLVSFGEDVDGELYAVSAQGTVARLVAP
jgi:glucose/arabinose dehydrogenase